MILFRRWATARILVIIAHALSMAILYHNGIFVTGFVFPMLTRQTKNVPRSLSPYTSKVPPPSSSASPSLPSKPTTITPATRLHAGIFDFFNKSKNDDTDENDDGKQIIKNVRNLNQKDRTGTTLIKTTNVAKARSVFDKSSQSAASRSYTYRANQK